MADVIFRVDGGERLHVAMGHAFRCMALARELRSLGLESHFLMGADPRGPDYVRERGFSVTTLPADTPAEEESRHIMSWGAPLVVVDLLHPDTSCCDRLMAAGARVVVLDDLGCAELCCDLVVNGQVISARHNYPDHIQKKLLGPRYMILGEEFDHPREASLKDEVEDILVTLGGADPRRFTPHVVQSLVEMEAGKRITVIRGPACAPLDLDQGMLSGIKTQVCVQENVADLSIKMMTADLVVAAGGRTACELAAMGTPGVLVPTADHEVEVAQALASQGIALAVSDATKDALGKELPGLVQRAGSLELRSSMTDAGRALIDGRGRRRVAQAILELSENRGGSGWGN